jgi:hypothetical protein
MRPAREGAVSKRRGARGEQDARRLQHFGSAKPSLWSRALPHRCSIASSAATTAEQSAHTHAASHQQGRGRGRCETPAHIAAAGHVNPTVTSGPRSAQRVQSGEYTGSGALLIERRCLPCVLQLHSCMLLCVAVVCVHAVWRPAHRVAGGDPRHVLRLCHLHGLDDQKGRRDGWTGHRRGALRTR